MSRHFEFLCRSTSAAASMNGCPTPTCGALSTLSEYITSPSDDSDRFMDIGRCGGPPRLRPAFDRLARGRGKCFIFCVTDVPAVRTPTVRSGQPPDTTVYTPKALGRLLIVVAEVAAVTSARWPRKRAVVVVGQLVRIIAHFPRHQLAWHTFYWSSLDRELRHARGSTPTSFRSCGPRGFAAR